MSYIDIRMYVCLTHLKKKKNIWEYELEMISLIWIIPRVSYMNIYAHHRPR